VYVLRPVDGIDVNATLGASSPYPWEEEIAVPWLVAPSDVRGVTIQGGSFSMLNPNYLPK
jgi:hypothetical protein